ncbi:MAG TPA: M48 family metalloprotease [Sphingomicrobium sp.]|nr:M48 family metalloprotease [Sphingomicrobium sp.]
MRKTFLLLAAAALALTPAAAQRLHYLNPQDVAEAQRENAALVQDLGGRETGRRAAYVDAVGHRVAAYSGIANPGQELHFTTLNSAVENAFSIPGGYVYVTRQLMVLMSDESQLAFALGHEVGHIAANHAHIREQYAERSTLGIFGQIVRAIFGPGAADILQARSALDFLSFSREQEYEADTLGLKYMVAAGYDPAGAAGVLAALSRESALEARVQGRSNRQTPEWASTHPLSENRLQRALAEAQATGRLGQGSRGRDTYLSELEGTFVDDDPAQGVIEGPTFTHPDLKIQFRVPQGYLMSNGTDAVTISGSAGKAQFRQGPADLDQAIAFAYRLLTGGQRQIEYPLPRRLVINGMQAAATSARVETNSTLLDASVVAYRWDPRRVYYFVMLTPGGYGISPFVPMINSLRRITPAEASAIRPRVIHIETIRPGDTLRSLSNKMAYPSFRLERFLSLNGLAANSTLVPGEKVKLVVYGTRRR